MQLDKERIQEFVNEVVSEYRKYSILGNGISVEGDNSIRVPIDQCREWADTDVDSINVGVALMSVRRQISQIISCEEAKIVQALEREGGDAKSISASSFAGELANLANSMHLSSDNRVLLPNHADYRVALEQTFGNSRHVGGRDGHPAYYFDQGILPNQGFVVSSQVYVQQEEQGLNSVVSDDLSIGELEEENSENLLQIHIGDNGQIPIDIELWTRFSEPQNVNEEKLIPLNLPDPGKVREFVESL